MPRSQARTPLSPEQVLQRLGNRPHSHRQLLQSLHLPAGRKAELAHLLENLVKEGRVVRQAGGFVALAQPKSAKFIHGRISQSQPGYAFLIPDEPHQKDLYIPAEDLKDAMPDDRVSARVLPGRAGRTDRLRGQVVQVLERAHPQLVGSLQLKSGYGLVKPDGYPFLREFFVPAEGLNSAPDRFKVLIEVEVWPTAQLQGRGRVLEVLGSADQPGMDITVIIRRAGLAERFSDAARAQAEAVAQEPGPAELAGRLDLRGQRIVTIDGADARDFDDAVFCEERPQGGWRLGVHIADVSHYLKEGTTLDQEARERGTSVYLPDRVLHMLPEPLSTGVCSLVPDKDRLTLSAFMEVEPDGRVTRTEFHRSVIHSTGRLTYEGVGRVLAGETPEDRAAAFVPELKRLQAVAAALRQQRQLRGNLDFDLPEPKVILGPDQRVLRIEKRVQGPSHRLIEDCMIAANEAVAEYTRRTDTPSLYRVHEPPSGEKLEELKEFLAAYGYPLVLGKAREVSKHFQRLLHAWAGKPEAAVLNMALLRAMKLAVYGAKNLGHFGLGSPCYSHFTSPIRRYPDLVVHRMLTERLAGPIAGRRRDELIERMPQWGVALSLAERRAEKAEREAVRAKQVEFMESRLGETFLGRITNVANFGFFVQLEEQFVEGLVRVADLKDDYYLFQDAKRYLLGANSGREIHTGQTVKVKVVQVDRETLQVTFTLAEPLPPANARPSLNRPRVQEARRPKKRRR